MLPYLNGTLAVLVLAAVAIRLTLIPVARHGHRLSWNLWIGAHAMIGAGCLGYILAMTGIREPVLAPTLTYFGLAIMLIVRWRRREGES